MLPCDEGEHGLQYVGGVKLARLGVALVGTLAQTPLRRAHLATLADLIREDYAARKVRWCAGRETRSRKGGDAGRGSAALCGRRPVTPALTGL